jgi:hypothetical protein
MGGLTRKPVPEGTDDEIIRALTRVPGRASVRARRFRHGGKPYIAYVGGVPAFKPGTLVATGDAVSLVADGHCPHARRIGCGARCRRWEKIY